MHELGHRAGANCTDVAGCVAEGIERLIANINGCLLAAHPDRKRRLGAPGSAAHGSVKQVHAPFVAQLVQPV